MTAAIEMAGLTRSYGATRALAGFDLTVAEGAYCVLLGPSGCGKTTLLNILGGLADPDGGTLRIGGEDVAGVPAARRPTIGLVRDDTLFPRLSLTDNVAFGLRRRGMQRRARRARAAEMLALVGLPEAGHRRPGQLSGDQRQRVALARALALAPQVLLLDEPLGALDPTLRRAMQGALKALHARVGITFVHATTDRDEAMALADHLVVMQAGRIADQGTPERVYRRPRSRFAASFLGEMTFLPGVVRRGKVETAFGPVGRAVRLEGTRLTLGLRPEHIHPGGGLPLGPAIVTGSVFQGMQRRVTLQAEAAPGQPILALLPAGQEAPLGAVIDLGIDTDHVIILEEPG